MGIKLIVRNCNESCNHYLKFEHGGRAICAYENNQDVISESQCKYEFLTENSVRELSSPEGRLVADIFKSIPDITLTEAREQLGLSN